MKKIIFLLSVSLISFVPRVFAQWNLPASPPSGGLVSSLIYDSSTDALYAGTNNGLFKTTNAGLSWDRISINSSFEFKQTTNILYTNGNELFSGFTNSGLHKSSDGGITWINASVGLDGYFPLSMVKNGGDYYVNTSYHVYKSSDQGITWTSISSYANDGIYTISKIFSFNNNLYAVNTGGGYRLNNFTGNWQPIITSMVGNSNGVLDITSQGNSLYISTNDGTYRSDNYGDSWYYTNNLPGAHQSLYSYNNELYTVFNSKLYVYSTTNNNWSISTSLSSLSSEAILDLVIYNNTVFAASNGLGVHKNALGNNSVSISANTGLSGGIQVNDFIEFNNKLLAAMERIGIHTSTDGGAQWSQSNVGIPLSSMYVKDLFTDGTNIYAVIPSVGIYRSVDGGDSWSIHGSGINGIFLSKVTSIGNDLYVGSIGKVYKYNTGNNTWSNFGTGLSSEIINDLISDGTYLYAQTTSTSSGNTSIYKIDPLNSTNWIASTSGIPNSSIQTMLYNNGIIFAGTNQGLYRSNDNGTNWISSSGGMYNASCNTLYSINGNEILAGSSGGNIFKSTDNGICWATASSSDNIPVSNSANIVSIGYHSISSTIIAGISNYGNIYLRPKSDIPNQPNLVSSISGEASICTNQNGVTYTALSNNTSNSYSWIVPSNATIVSSYLNSVIIDFSGFSGGSVSVVESNSGCTGPIAIKILVISQLDTDGDVLKDCEEETIGTDPINPDSDGDGIYDGVDDIIDTDNDGLINALDFDSDNDNITDNIEGGIIDTDGDNIKNYLDLDSDADGFTDLEEGTGDEDSDGTPNYIDPYIDCSNTSIPIISGIAFTCDNQSNKIYNVNNQSTSTYTWTVPSDYTITSGQGTNSITVTTGTTTGAISVTETTANGCTATSAPFTITPSTGPVLTSITGADQFCANNIPESYFAQPSISTVNYVWSVDNGGTLNSQQFNLGQFNLLASQGSHTISVKAVNLQGCESATISKTVTRKLNISSITGPASTCIYSNGNSYNVATGLAGESYFWQTTSGNVTTGNGTNQITLSTSNNPTFTVSVTKSDATGCAASSTLTVANKPPLMTIGITGLATVCPNQSSVTYSTTNRVGASYTWIVPTGATILSGQNTNSISVTYSNFNSFGVIQVELNDPAACKPVSANLTVSSALSATSSMFGPDKVCANAQLISYSLPNTSGSTYFWTVPTGATIIFGQGTQSIVVGYTNFTSGNITVLKTLAGGCAEGLITKAVSSIGVSASYVVPAVNVSCNSGSFAIQITTPAISAGVKSFNLGFTYDPRVISLTGAPTKYTPGPVLTSVGLSNLNQNYYNYSLNASSAILMYSVYASTGTFSGGGNVVSFNFDVKFGAIPGDFTPITITTLQEGLEAGGQTAVCPASIGLVTIVNAETLLKGKLLLSNTSTPLGYNSAAPSQFLPSVINGATSASCGISTFTTLPDVSGNFEYDISTGDYISIKRDIANTTDVFGYINSNDALRINQLGAGLTSPLPTMYDMIAADVDFSGYVNGNDASFILDRLVNGSYTQQPVSPKVDWVFLDNTTFTSIPFKRSTSYPLNDGVGFSLDKALPAYSTCLPIRKVSNGTCSDIPTEVYRGILLGDVANPKFNNQGFSNIKTSGSLAGYTPTYSEGTLVIDLSKSIKTENDSYLIPVYQYAGDTSQAFDLQVDYDESLISILNVINAKQEIVYAWNKLNNGKLVIGGYTMNALSEGAPVYYIEVTNTSSMEKESWGTTFRALINGSEVDGVIKTVDSENNLSGLSVYPNPALDMIYLSAIFGEFTVEINSITGEQVYASRNENAIAISSLASGLYIISVKSESGSRRIKFSKIR